MYLKHVNQPVYRLRYINSTDLAADMPSALTPTADKPTAPEVAQKKQRVKSFLDPGESTFANIRKRLSTLTLPTDYHKNLDSNRALPVLFEHKLPPRRISSISSRDTTEKHRDTAERHGDVHSFPKPRVLSRTSFFSDDRDSRNVRNYEQHRHRASETAAANKLRDSFLTPSQNPELFSRQIRLKDKQWNNFKPRSNSPKSVRSVDSSGKVHLGLIESLDLNEHLSDVEKIKARYSNDQFMNSLTLYKLRGHDRCHYPDGGSSEHIPRGTRIADPEFYRLDVSPYKPSASDSSLNTSGNPDRQKEWKPDKSYLPGQGNRRRNDVRRNGSGKASVRSKKSVGFNMTPLEMSESEDELTSPPSTRRERLQKEPKSILKRSMKGEESGASRNALVKENSSDDEFMNSADKRWKYHLPKIHSPVHSFREKQSIPFRKKMYHFGDGVSREFEQVINKYGNCRQNSMVRDQSFAREGSQART